MAVYLQERGPLVVRRDFLAVTAKPIIAWWGMRPLSDVRAGTCADYVTWRCAQGVSDQTARHDLKTMRAAIRYYHANYGPLDAVPAVTLPARREGRTRWLERHEAAKLLWAARRVEHVKRLALIVLYSGTRPGAALALRWMPSPTGGWIDVDGGVIHRRGDRQGESRKRKPPVKIHSRLLPHLRRWRRADLAHGITAVCHYNTETVRSLHKAWRGVRARAELGADVTPHVLRHTCVTWLLQAGVPAWEVAGFAGMSLETLERVYGHHSPKWQERAASAIRR